MSAKSKDELQNILGSVVSGIDSCNHAEVPDLTGCEILEGEYNVGDCAESDGWALVKLADGRYAFLYESEDTTGHGCQCSGDVSYYDTLEAALQFHRIEMTR